MTRVDLVKEIRKDLEKKFSLKEVDVVVVAMLDALKRNIKANEPIFLRGFGTFELVTRGPSFGRNIRTNEVVKVPKRRVVRFIPGKELKAIKKLPF